MIAVKNIISKSEVEQLAVGDILPNMFGVLEPVTRILHKGLDDQGRFFAYYYQAFGEGAEMSALLKEGGGCPR